MRKPCPDHTVDYMGTAPLHKAAIVVYGNLGLAADRNALLRLLATGFTLRDEVLPGFDDGGEAKQDRTEHQSGRFHGR